MKPLILPRGHQMLVDEIDAHLFEGTPWHAIPARGTFYAQSGRDTAVLAHRLITGAQPGVLVDHANRNGLDNRRSNLRLCTHSQNQANRPVQSNNTSGYKGVSRRESGRWAAYLTVGGVRRSLGAFVDPWHAAQAYNRAAVEAFGEFAYLNVYRPQSARDGGPGCPGTSGGGGAQ